MVVGMSGLGFRTMAKNPTPRPALAEEKRTLLKALQNAQGDFFPPLFVENIVKLVSKPLVRSRREELHEDLEIMAGEYFVRRSWDAELDAKNRYQEISAVVMAAELLLKRMNAADSGLFQKSILFDGLVSAANLYAERHGEYPEFPARLVTSEALGEFLDYNGADAVMAAIEGVQRLCQWAGEEASRLKPPSLVQNRINIAQKLIREKAVAAGRKPEVQIKDSPEQWLVGFALPNIYKKYFGPYQIPKPYSSRGYAYGHGIIFVQMCLKRFEIKIDDDAIKKHYIVSLKLGTSTENNSSDVP